eukprot:241165-Alexandrium_andersonii.AAC.1
MAHNSPLGVRQGASSRPFRGHVAHAPRARAITHGRQGRLRIKVDCGAHGRWAGCKYPSANETTPVFHNWKAPVFSARIVGGRFQGGARLRSRPGAVPVASREAVHEAVRGAAEGFASGFRTARKRAE